MTAENWLNIPEIAGKVASAIRHFDGQRYELICYTVMPNHVHLVMDLALQVTSNTNFKVCVRKYKGTKLT